MIGWRRPRASGAHAAHPGRLMPRWTWCSPMRQSAGGSASPVPEPRSASPPASHADPTERPAASDT